MKTLPHEHARTLWDKWWDQMQHEWFKLEVLQDYSAEDEGKSLRNWLKGDRTNSLRLMKKDPDPEFTQRCQNKIKLGVKLIRMHIIDEPLTPYLQWEIEFYRQVSIPLRGEMVYLLNRLEAPDLEIPACDMMIFDKKRVVVNTYNDHGLMTHQTFYDEHDDITKFLVFRKKLMTIAISI